MENECNLAIKGNTKFVTLIYEMSNLDKNFAEYKHLSCAKPSYYKNSFFECRKFKLQT